MADNNAKSSNANDILRWCGAVAIALVAVARCCIVFAPQVVFDVDPAFDPTRLAGLSPAGSLVLDVVLLAASGVAMLGEARSGRGLDWRLFTLALVPAPILLWHGHGDLLDLWIGSTWLAGMLAAVTVAHLVRDPRMRIATIALLLAVVAPLLVRGAGQVTYEHAEKVAEFEENRERFFAANGIDPDSPSALIFERRLRQRNPQGWFATTNVYASVLGLALVALPGFVIASVRRKMESGWAATTGLVLLAVAAGLWMCDSRGALLAATGGLVVFLAPLLLPLVRRLFERFGGAILMLVLLATIGGVVVRGVVLPEGFAGERSLLFRWHYATATVRMVAEAPLTGVGPGGYQQAYARHRVPRNPEEVTSAHNMFLDWLAAGGVWGAAWIGLVGVFTWRMGNRFGAGDGPEDVDGRRLMRPILWAAAGIAIVGLGGTAIIELLIDPDPLDMLLRALGMLGYVTLALVLASILICASSRWIEWAVIGGVVAMLIHGQIEMTFAQPAAVAWALAMLGAVAPAGNGRSGHGLDTGLALVPVALALWLALTAAVPAIRQQVLLHEAAAVLADFPHDAATRVDRRSRASGLLAEAHEIMPSNPHPIERAAQQLTFAATQVGGSARVDLLRQALALSERARHPDRGFAISLRTSIYEALARELDSEQFWDRAITEAERLSAIDPHGNTTWRRLGDLRWEAGRPDAAREAYRRALQTDDQFELDPLKQFPPAVRRRIESRLDP